jgi:hypothetical protein
MRIGDLVVLRCARCGWRLQHGDLPRNGRPAACPGCWRDLAGTVVRTSFAPQS